MALDSAKSVQKLIKLQGNNMNNKNNLMIYE